MSNESSGETTPVPAASPKILQAVVNRAFAFSDVQMGVSLAGVPLGPLFVIVPLSQGLFAEDMVRATAILVFGLFFTGLGVAFLAMLAAGRRKRQRLINAVRTRDENVVSWQWEVETVDSGRETGNVPLGRRVVLTAAFSNGSSDSVTITRLADAALLLRHIAHAYPTTPIKPRTPTPTERMVEESPVHLLPALREIDEPVEHPAILGPFVLLGGGGLVCSLLLFWQVAQDLHARTATVEAGFIAVWLPFASAAILRAGLVASGTSILGASLALGKAMTTKEKWRRGLAVLAKASSSSVRVIAFGAGVAAALTFVASLLGVTIPARTGAFRVWVAPDGIGVAFMMAVVAFLLWKLADLHAAAPAWLRRAGPARGLALGLAALVAAGVAGYGVKRYLWHGNELYWAIETDKASVVLSWLARVDDRAGVATELFGRALAVDAPEVAEVLLDAGAVTFPFPPGLADDPGASESALHSVCGWGGPKVLRLLLERGADPNYPGVGGRTPLHALLWREGLDRERLRTDATQLAPMLDLLLSHGADPTRRPEPEKPYSLSPIEEAVHGGLDAVAERMRRGVPAAKMRPSR